MVPSLTTSSSLIAAGSSAARGCTGRPAGRPRRRGGGSGPTSARLYHAVGPPVRAPLVPSGPAAGVVGRTPQDRAREQDDALRAALQRPEVVVAGEGLDPQARRLGHRHELVGRRPAAACRPGPSGPAARPGRPPRTWWSGARSLVVGSQIALPVLVTVRPVPGSSRTHSSTRRPSYRARSSASGSQQSTTASPPGREVRRERRDRGGLVGAGAHEEQRVERDERQLERPRGREADLAGVAVHELEAPRRRDAGARRRRPAPARASPGRGRRP